MIIFINLILILSGIYTVLSRNPVHSIFYLILSFVSATFLLLILKVEFIAMLFLIVYIGAISVLFLFVVMMLNIKIVELNEKIIKYIPIGLFIMFIFFFELFYMINSSLFYINENFLFTSFTKINVLELNKINLSNFYELLDIFTNVNALSFILYTKYIYLFLISGIILLVAMLGAIILTLNKHGKFLHQDLFFQINKELKSSYFTITNKTKYIIKKK